MEQGSRLARLGRQVGAWVAAWPPSAWLGVVLAVGIAVWITLPAWGPRPISGDDIPYHLLRTDWGISQVLARFRLDAWFARDYLGHQGYLFYGPGVTWFIALARVLSLGLLSNVTGLNLVTIASFVLFPAAVAFIARSYGLGRRASGIAALLALLVSNPFGLGLHGTFVIGLISHQVGAIWFCLALGSLLRIPVDDRPRWVVLGGVSLAMLAVTHQLSGIVLLIVWVVSFLCLPLSDRPTADMFKRLAVTGALAFGLAGFYMLPALAHRDLVGQVTGWDTPPLGQRLDDVFRGDMLFPPGVALAMLLGWAYGAYRLSRNRRYALALMAAPLTFLIFGHWAGRTGFSMVTSQIANRGLGYAGVLALLPLAAFLGKAATWLAERIPGADLTLVVVIGMAVFQLQGPWRTVPAQEGEPTPQWRAAATELARIVPAKARFAVERDLANASTYAHVPHEDMWLTYASGRNSLNGEGAEYSPVMSAIFAADQVGQESATQVADTLPRLGVTHLVVVRESTLASLTATGSFKVVWQRPPVTILEVLPASGQPPPSSLLSAAGPLSAKTAQGDPEHLRIAFDAPQRTNAQVALSWSPKWRASVDGKSAEVVRGPDSIMQVALPAGAHTLALDFGPDVWDWTGLLLTFVTIAGFAAWGFRRRPWFRRGREAILSRLSPGGS